MSMDRSKIESAIRSFLEGIGERFGGDDLEATPDRVARAWAEDLVSGYAVDPDTQLTWTEIAGEAGAVIVRGVSFASMCVHHLLPFNGFAHIAYLPQRRLAGLSKIGRVVDAHARRLQTQERLSAEILGTLDRVLEPRGAVVQLSAGHTCMTLRGVRKEQSRMITVASSGLYQSDVALRAEILALLRGTGDGSTG